jgi:hypothetical protein
MSRDAWPSQLLGNRCAVGAELAARPKRAKGERRCERRHRRQRLPSGVRAGARIEVHA